MAYAVLREYGVTERFQSVSLLLFSHDILYARKSAYEEVCAGASCMEALLILKRGARGATICCGHAAMFC